MKTELKRKLHREKAREKKNIFKGVLIFFPPKERIYNNPYSWNEGKGRENWDEGEGRKIPIRKEHETAGLLDFQMKNFPPNNFPTGI